jgi:hypothetical protein
LKICATTFAQLAQILWTSAGPLNVSAFRLRDFRFGCDFAALRISRFFCRMDTTKEESSHLFWSE